MTFLQKLIWFFVIFFVSYILLIFNSPVIAGAIEKVLGIEGFNEFILGFKSTYDKTVTSVPTQEELKNAYDVVHSGAIELKDNFGIGLDYTKEKIDGYRETLSGAEDTYNELFDGYNEFKDYVNTNSGLIDEVRDTIEAFSGIAESLTNSGTITLIQETIEKVTDITEELTGTGEELTETGTLN